MTVYSGPVFDMAVQQFGVIRVARERVHDLDVGPDLVASTEDRYFLLPVPNAAAQGVFGAIADEQHGG